MNFGKKNIYTSEQQCTGPHVNTHFSFQSAVPIESCPVTVYFLIYNCFI